MLKEDLKHITTEHLRDTNKISVRTANCCISIGLNTLYEIVLCFENNGSFLKKKMKNAGRKTCEELDELCANIIPNVVIEKPNCEIKEVSEIINELTEQERKILQSLANLIVETENIAKNKKRIFEKHCINDFSFAIDFYIKNGHLPMFWILEQYIVNDRSREIDILINSFEVFSDSAKYLKDNIVCKYEVKSLEEIAEKHQITRERTRQIRNDVFRKTFAITDEIIEYSKNDDLIKYGQLLQNKDDWAYFLDLIRDLFLVFSYDIQNQLHKEKCNLSMHFAMQIIAYVFRDKFVLWGGFDISDKEKIWENTFLVQKEYVDVFDFEKFKREFTNLIVDNEKEYPLNIEHYVSDIDCWIPTIDLNKYDGVISIVKDILPFEFSEFELVAYNEYVTIPATKERNLSDVVFEILQQNNRKPMYLNEIFDKFKKIFPEHKYTQENNPDGLRPYLQKHEAIMSIGRKSLFALKKWDYKKDIKEAAIEFLTNNALPQTAEDVAEYVLQYFPETNIGSIKSNISSDPKKRFLFFANGLLGLKNKQYPPEYEEIERQEEQRRTFEQRLYDLEKFLSENDHFPFATSENEDEVSLYRWWRIQNRSTEQLSEQQKADIERINIQYADFDTDKTIYEWFCNSNQFKLFLLENCRMPSAIGSEKYLYGWGQRAKRNYENNKLNDKQRKTYIELSKLL